MTYAELVQKTLLCRLSDIEMGLSKAREQKTFVENVSRLLDKTGRDYTVRMDNRFGVTFNVGLSDDFNRQFANIECRLKNRFDVQTAWNNGTPVIYVYSRRENEDGIGCKVVFGDVP